MTTGSVLAQFTITLSQAVSEQVAVEWHTADGTALAGVDYAAAKGTVIFAPGQTAKTVDILVHGRAVGAEDRSFFVEMLPPTNAILGASIGECIIHVDTTGSTPVTQIIVPTGPQGLQGDSAYQAWLDLGNTGTEEDFINSLKPSAEEIAEEVAPILNVSNSPLTAEGTETLSKPDTMTGKRLARRVAYVGSAKVATVVLADGDNLITHAALSGDAVDFNSISLYPRILRGTVVISPEWSVEPGDKILIKSAVAGDVLHVCQYDVISERAVRNVVEPLVSALLAPVGSQVFEALRRSYAEAGYNVVGTFRAGFTIVNANDVGIDETTGKGFTGPAGDVAAGTDPASGGFVDESGELLSATLSGTSGAGLIGLSHSLLYAPASVGYRLRLSAYVTDAPYSAVMGANVSDAQAELNAIAFQSAIDSGVPVQIPAGGLRLKRPAGATYVLAVYPNTTIIGAGRRHGLVVTSGTEVLVDCPQNGQLFELKDRAGQVSDGQGTLRIEGAAFINTGAYLAFTTSGANKYYTPTYGNVLTANTRGLWASASVPTTDWGGYSDWRAKKDGGVDCPFLVLKDVKFQNFTFPVDAHTWMAELDGVEPYLCGPMRLYGTSVKATNCWPRNPLAHCWETRLQYSNISASSLGENVPVGQFGGGLHNYGGAVRLTAVGAEKTNLTHVACFKGVVHVDGIEIVAGGAAQAIGKVYAEDAFIVWEAMPRCLYSDGSQSEFADDWFAATSETLLKNHVMKFSATPGNFWGNSPWLPKLGGYSGSNFVAPFATNDAGLIGSPFIRMPSVLNRLREVACAHVAIKERVILRGVSQRLTLKIYGTFDDEVTSASETNPRQKHGTAVIKVRPMASQDGTGAAVTPVFNYAEYAFSFSRTASGVVQIERKHGDGFDTSKVQAFFTTSVNNGGFDVKVGLLTQGATYDTYAQCIVDVEYEGSCNNNTAVPGKTVELVVS